MKTALLCRPLLVCAALTPLLAPAQPTAPAAQAAPAEEPIRLSVFEVSSTQDAGYRVENAVATTGFAQALIDTPLPITVVTGEFLRDAGLEGFIGAMSYVSGVTLDPHASNGNYSPGLGRGNGQANGNRFRGQPYNGTFRNGLRLGTGFDTENVDRIEVAKGPMAVFIGGATLGGEVNLVTKKPQFQRADELTLKVGSHSYYRATLDSTGPLTRTLAYRLILDANDKETWRDHSDSRSFYINPQLLWRPSRTFDVRLDAYYRKATGNLVSQNVTGTVNYQSAYNDPAPALLELGRRRTTGPGAGLPFTVEEYRTRIGQAFGTWRQDVFDTTGRWVSLGEGEDLIDGNAPSGRRYNYYGPNAGFEEPVALYEVESTWIASDLVQVRGIARFVDSKIHHDYYSFGQRIYADGNNPLNFGSGTRTESESFDSKVEAVIGRPWRFLDPKLIVGGQYGRSESYTEDAFFDYSGLAPVPASPNVFNNPANPLTGQQIFQFFDPRVHAFPDTRAVTRWPSEVRPAGQGAYGYGRSISRAVYAATGVGFWEGRATLTAGARRNFSRDKSGSLDRDRVPVLVNGVPQLSSSKPEPVDSYMYGLSVRLRRGLNAYASYNRGETTRGGSLVSRVSFGISPPDIVTEEERRANPVPNETGTGKELGLKFSTANGKLTGSFGWFQLVRGNVLVTDTVRNGNDPRNVGTEVDNNTATANPGVRARVNWVQPIEGNSTEGYEMDLVWSPNDNYSVILGASHLTTNEQTVDRPPTSDPILLRDFTILNGRPLDFAPDTLVRLFQRYEFSTGRLKGASVGLGVRYQSEMWGQPANSAWGIIFPSFIVGDLNLGYDTKLWGRDTSFLLHIENITNSTYIEGNRVFGAPRQAFLTVRTRF